LFGIITDTHLRGKDWTDKTSVLNEVKRQMRGRGVKVIINLGDLFDNYGRLNDKYVTTNSVAAFLNDWLSSQDVTLISIEGNHDQSGQESAYDIFNHPKQVVIKNRVSWVSVEGNYFICVPWLTNNRVGGVDARLYAKEMIKECYNDVIASAKRTGSKVESLNLVGHLDAVGAKIRDHVSITSEEYSKYCFDFESLINEVGYLDNIFLGHIHYRQPVKARGEGYYGYIGYVAPLGHGELENPNGWVFFDGKNIEFVDVEAPKYYQVHTQDLIDNVGNFKHWDRVRVIGTPTVELPTKHVEVLGEKLESNAVREYIENKNTSLKDIYTKWLALVGVTPKDPDAVLAYLDGLNIRWESLTGKLSKIHSIEIENIGPHKYFKHEFATGVTTILGKNGAGKSWILESFPYCVFGEWPTRRGSASSYMTKDSKLTVKFDVDGTVYYAIRTEKGLTAYDKDMKDLTGKLKRSSKEWFEERLGEKDNFLHCCFSDQKSFNDLIDCDPSSRMHMLRAFLKLDVFDAYHEEIKNNLAATKAKYDQCYEKGSGLGESMLELEEAKREYTEVSEEYADHAPKSKSLVDRFHECHTAQLKIMEYENMEHKVASLSQDLAKADDQVIQMETLIAKLKKPLTNAECSDIKYKINELKDKRRNIYDVQNRIKDLKGRVSRLDLSKVGCSPNHLSCILINDVVEAKKELDSLVDTSSELPSISNEIERYERNLTSNTMLVNELTSNTYKLDILKKNKETVLSQFLKAKDLLESKEKPVIPGNVEQVQELYNQYHAHELKLVRKQAQLESRIEVLNKTIVEKNNIVTNILPALELQLDTLMVLEKAFSKYGIPHYMASSALPELQEIFNSLLKVSFEDRLHIVFDNISDPTSKKIKENFSIIKMNARRPHDVRYSSPGEQSILKTLWKLTLLTFQARRNEGYRVLFLDEPTTSQDADNVEATMRVLQYVSGFFDQVIMVTHDAQLAELADNKIVLE